jgi:ubiquinone/menaquinone biosynthesis C-methylase UbiE
MIAGSPSSMPERATYIHGTETSEQHRLVALNRLTNGPFVDFLDVGANDRIVEVGSGLGILAGAVADAAAGSRVIAIEQSAAQLASARRHTRVWAVRGDAHAIPLADDSIDVAYARYVLEHVADPAAVLTDMRRVLRRGGKVVVMENDVTTIRFDPPCPRFEAIWVSFAILQRQLGGDALIGRRLYRLFHDAGFRQIELSVQPEVHWHGSAGWIPWVTNIIGNVESARRALIQRGLSTNGEVDAAVRELDELIARPDGSSIWIWSRARGFK